MCAGVFVRWRFSFACCDLDWPAVNRLISHLNTRLLSPREDSVFRGLTHVISGLGVHAVPSAYQRAGLLN